MCRIFGFRSILDSRVHTSLIDADNSIIHQSQRHPDGWGVAYYNLGSPHLIKLDNQAKECKIFEKVSGVVSSHTLLAHIRKSTVGPVGPLNTHPFQFGPWVFAHNGNVENFENHREEFLKCVAEDFRRYILGDTDSEVLFYLLLTIMRKVSQKELEFNAEKMHEVLDQFIRIFQSIAGPVTQSRGDYDKNYLTFVLTNGKTLLAFQGGQSLYFSTHKKKCPERGSCSFFKPICETKAKSQDKVHHLLVSSEQIRNENIWTEMSLGEYVLVDEDLVFFKNKINFGIGS